MHTERGFDRLVNFSDAVVAIAITLLVLPLVDIAGDVATDGLVTVFTDNLSKFFAFALSFAVIGRFWLTHHRIYESVIDYNRSLMSANMVWLFSIVFLPFPTELLGSASSSVDPAVTGLYLGTMLVSTASGWWQRLIVVRHPELQAEEVRGTLSSQHGAIATGIMAAALIIAVALPQVGMWSLLLLFASRPIERLLDRRRPRENAAAGSPDRPEDSDPKK